MEAIRLWIRPTPDNKRAGQNATRNTKLWSGLILVERGLVALLAKGRNFQQAALVHRCWGGMTDWTCTDTTKLPLQEGIDKLAAVASPLSSPPKSGQHGVLLSKAVPAEKSDQSKFSPETVEPEEACPVLDGVVQSCPELVMVPGGRTHFAERESI